ncbi:MAG: YhgE/Pip family protein [Atopobiaceae bacterium]
MKTVLRIFLRDLKRILRNPVALIVTLGVCIIPSLYAWFNILANWDPYENTSGIAIAVVNEDQGATAGTMGYINAGDMVVEKLQENTQLGWTFVDEDEGLEGVKSGKYYATIVLPSDFTSSLADVLDGNTDKAHLEYYVNEKVNAVSPKVTDTGASTIENQINDTFAGTVSKVIAEKVASGAGDVLNEADAGERGIEDELRDAQTSLDNLNDQLNQTQDTLQAARDAAGSARDTLGSVESATDQASATLRSALDSLGTTRSQARTLSSKLSDSLGYGVTQVGNISSRANYDVSQLSGDVSGATTTFNDAITRLQDELNSERKLETEITNTRSLAGNISDTEVRTQVTTQLDLVLDDLHTLTDDQNQRLNDIKAKASQINKGSQQVADLADSLNSSLQDSSDALTGLRSDLEGNTVSQLDSALDTFSDSGNGLYASMASLDPLLSQTEGLIDQLDGTLSQAQTTISTTSDQISDASSALQKLADDLGTIRQTELWNQLQKASQLDPESVGDYMNGPVQIDERPIFSVENYGSGVTPFYTNLALWVGGFVLVAIYKLEVDKEGIGDFRPWQGYLGRWLLLNLLGFLQAVICCVGDLFLGIQCVSPVAFVFAGIVESFAYVGFIYALSIAFKHIGKALGVLLVVLQIPGSSGTYPIEMMPGFFQALSPWLPFTYGINAMRESIAGFYGNYYAWNLGMLLLLLVLPSILIGMVARRHLLNINTLFDRKLTETDLMIGERVPAGERQFKLSTIVKAIINSREYSQVLLQRAAKFELMYPLLIKRGFWSLIIVPAIFLVLMFVVDAKYVFLTLWIISLVIICTFLIVVEYMHTRVDQKTELASYSQDQLLSMLDNKLKDELFAFAPIEKLHLTHGSLVDRLRDLRNSTPGVTSQPNDQSQGNADDGQQPDGRPDSPAGDGAASPDQTQLQKTMRLDANGSNADGSNTADTDQTNDHQGERHE